MLIQCLSAFCILGVVIAGLLVMMQIVSLEELGSGIRQAFLVIVIALIMLGFLEGLLLPILTCGLIWLKQAMLWVLVIVLTAVASIVVVRMLFLKLVNWNSRGNSDRGKYE